MKQDYKAADCMQEEHGDDHMGMQEEH